jgi:hypothetical protein
MGLWVYFVLASLRMDAQTFGKLSTDGVLPRAFDQIVGIMVRAAIEDDVNAQDLLQVLAYLREWQAGKPDDFTNFTINQALKMVTDRVYSHTEKFRQVYPDAKHPILA